MRPGPAVSVIVPTYQRRELVRRAVESVLSQTFRDFELIVIDDGSSDGTEEALTALADDRLHYAWQPNRGVAAARNRGLELARGEIVAFLDSDDRWLPDHLETTTQVLDRLQDAVLVTTSPRHVVRGRARPGDAWTYDPLPVQLYANPVGYPSCVAVRRAAVVAAGGFDERLQVGEDGDLWARVARLGRFAALERRTMEKLYTPGLRHWGSRRGDYHDAFEQRAQRGVDGHRRGALAFARALRALDAGDDEAVAARLAEACRHLPELSSKGELVEERLSFLQRAHEPAEAARYLETAARLWPERGADTPRFLQLCALALAVRAGRPAAALRLLLRSPSALSPGFLWRSLPAIRRRVHRALHARRRAGNDGVDLDARPAIDQLAQWRPAGRSLEAR